MEEFTHLDEQGRAKMVDVSGKEETAREAKASCVIRMHSDTMRAIADGGVPKGDVVGVARVAGIQAVKRTSSLIPLCHPLAISGIDLDFETVSESELKVTCAVRTTDRTGVEMEALTGACLAALTVYDMCKAVDKGMLIGELVLEEKRGGRSGEYRRRV